MVEEKNKEDSIYEDDRVEKSFDDEPDIFDDVFGEDEERAAARKKMKEKAEENGKKKEKEAKEKIKENKTDDDLEENDDNEDDEDEDEESDEEDDTEEDEEDSYDEPDLFIDKDIKDESKLDDAGAPDQKVPNQVDDDLEEKKKLVDEKLGKKKKTSNFNQMIEEGLNKSIKKGSEDSIIDAETSEGKAVAKSMVKGFAIKNAADKVKENTGKLNIKIQKDSEDKEEPKKKKEKASAIEKNIIKNVIKNKASKVAKEKEEEILKDKMSKEEYGFEQEAEDIAKKEGKKEIKKNSVSNIKPKLGFLENEASGNAYIGRKKSILKKYGDEGGLFVGRVGEEDLHHKPVYLDGLNPHVVFVCGARGSGKSYVLGVLAEELAIKNKNVGIVVVDPIGVFWSMKYPNKDEKELELLADWNIMPQGLNNIKVFIPVGMKSSVPKNTYDATFSIQPSLLTAEDWCLTFGMDRFSPVGLLLDKVLEKVKKGFTTIDEENPKTIRGKENTYSLDDLIFCLDNDSEINGGSKGYKPESIRALVSRFDAAKSWGVFDESGTPLSLLSRAGQMTILDTSFLDDTVGALVIGIISRRLLAARKLSTRRESAGKFDDNAGEELVEINVPPTWLFIDEAHTLIPGGNQKTPASNAIVEYVKQGRRPGLSLVFATQQPSAIDSKVLSQLDVIMAHKLVFDDDVKAIHKRTPTIIPGNYKKPNFIKTLPVGTALTGDRQETSTRAFVMNIRPRMSQHEGRDAETIKVEHNLDDEQVQKLAINIVKSKLAKDPSIKIVLMEQILETLNATYNKKVTIEQLLLLLDEEKIDYDEINIYAPGVLQEIEDEKKEDERRRLAKEKEEAGEDDEDLEERDEDDQESDEKSDEEDIEFDDSGKPIPKNQEDELDEEPEYEETVELTALKAMIEEADARKMLASYRLKKRLGLFGEEEILDRLSLKYATLYKLRYNYFSQKDAFQIGEAYVNALTCEFIHDRNGKIIESSGLSILKDMKDAEIQAVKLLENKHHLKSLAKNMGMEEGNAKRILETLAKKDLVAVSINKEEFYYSLKKKFDLPPSPIHSIMPSIGRRPIIEVEMTPLIEAKYNEKEVAEIVKKLWHNIRIKEITHLFLPVWEGVLKKKTGEERIVRIDGINGNRIE